jgi:ABC-type transport system involved in multi-copper enzyme maturation permease subunit
MNLRRLGTVIALELTQRVRSVAWYVLLGVFAVLLLAVTLLTFAAAGGSPDSGGTVYSVVVYFVLLLVVLVSPTLSGNAINGDREAATLAPVQVTLTTTPEIVIGKLIAAWIAGLAFVVVALPFVVVAVIAGGVSPLTALVSALVLILEIGVVAAIGVGLSGILTRPLFSVASTYLVVAALVIGTVIAFALSGLASQTQVKTYSRDVVYDDQGNATDLCGEWTTDTSDQPRFERVWWMLAPNPFVILADATPARFESGGYPLDAFSGLKVTVREAQIPPKSVERYDGCRANGYEDTTPDPHKVLAETTPSWAVGVAIQLVLAGGLMLWGGMRTRTPARRLARGSRIA